MMMPPPPSLDFWFLARCNFCGWTARTQSKAEFDRDVKEHRQAHK